MLYLVAHHQLWRVFQFQTSTNFLNWVSMFLVTNNGTITTYYVTQPISEHRFYRMIPQ